MAPHKYFYRKLQERGNPPYFQIHYDFNLQPGRGKFYRKAPKILGGPITNFTLTKSVIGVFDEDTAKIIFELAKDCKAESVVLCKAQTLNQYP